MTGSSSFAESRFSGFGKLKIGVSLAALSVLALSGPAYAQAAKDAAPEEDEIIVSGIRESLANSQSIKKNADTVVDAITAEDIGALPDRSVTEALQRVPGVSINRFAGSNDPDHFSVEGSGTVIRGLNFVRSEFNGRDAFAAGGYGQGLNFADVPAELLGSVEVYKNASADMIEGGLAGTVNLNTRKPFDNKGFHLGFGAEGSYGDFEKKWSPTGSLLISNTWETDGGTFGLLASGSFSQVRSRSDGLQVTNFQTRDGKVTFKPFTNEQGLVCRTPLPSSTDAFGYPTNAGTLVRGGDCFSGPAPAGANGFADNRASAVAPLGAQFRTQNFDRKRDGVALAGQFETADRAALFTVQYIRSHSTNAWRERTFESGSDLSEYNTFPKGCQANGNGAGGNPRAECPVGGFTNYTYDNNGLFQKGYITLPTAGWRGNPSDSPWVPLGGMQQNVNTRQVLEEVTNQDLGLNAKIDFNDHWHLDLDFDYTKSNKQNLDVSLIGGSFADQELDLTGRYPQVRNHKPNNLYHSWATGINPAMEAMNDTQFFSDRRTQFWRAGMDHKERSTGSQYSFRGDLTYKFDDDSFLKELKLGARYADRSQIVRYTTYNWGMLSETWAGKSPVSVAQVGGSDVDFYGFENFFRGKAGGPVGGYYYNGDLIKDYAGFVGFTDKIRTAYASQGGTTGWRPLGKRAGVDAEGFLPREIQPVKQQDTNLYAMLRFGNDDPVFGDVRLSGNVGVRYVSTSIASTGTISAPSASALGVADPFSVRCAGAPPGAVPAGVVIPPGPLGVCALGEKGYNDLRTWATGKGVFNVARNNYSYLLPSLNVKFGVSDDVIFRFAASKVLTRPQNDYIRNYFDVGFDNVSNTIRSDAGNPFLKPATAWQFDVTGEWYFSRVGSLTFDVFYKKVSDFFYQKIEDRIVESNGIRQPVLIRGPANYDKTGTIKGAEIAYQQTFDFLPGFLSGLGFNGNYTYIKSKGIPNSLLNGSGVATPATIPAGNLPLEQLSKHNLNATLFYEKGPISLRAAYNWRSRFLLTASDVIFPYYPIFNEATGQLDASIFFNLTKSVKIGVQGVNLLNEVTKTSQAYSIDPGKLAPRSYFMADRRFSFILRGNF